MLFVHAVLKIADRNVCFGLASDLERLDGKTRVADFSPDERGVEDYRFNKAFVRAAQNLVGLGLLNASRRIGSSIDYDGLGVAFNDHSDCAGKNKGRKGFKALFNARFNIGYVTVKERLRVRAFLHVLFGQLAEIFEHFFKHLVFNKAVNAIERYALSPGRDTLDKNVKAFADSQLSVYCGLIFFIAFFKITHIITNSIVGVIIQNIHPKIYGIRYKAQRLRSMSADRHNL